MPQRLPHKKLYLSNLPLSRIIFNPVIFFCHFLFLIFFFISRKLNAIKTYRNSTFPSFNFSLLLFISTREKTSLIHRNSIFNNYHKHSTLNSKKTREPIRGRFANIILSFFLEILKLKSR